MFKAGPVFQQPEMRRIRRMQHIVDAMKVEVEEQVAALFGTTFFLDSPTPARLGKWRAKAQTEAAAMRADITGLQTYAQQVLASVPAERRLLLLANDVTAHRREIERENQAMAKAGKQADLKAE